MHHRRERFHLGQLVCGLVKNRRLGPPAHHQVRLNAEPLQHLERANSQHCSRRARDSDNDPHSDESRVPEKLLTDQNGGGPPPGGGPSSSSAIRAARARLFAIFSVKASNFLCCASVNSGRIWLQAFSSIDAVLASESAAIAICFCSSSRIGLIFSFCSFVSFKSLVKCFNVCCALGSW